MNVFKIIYSMIFSNRIPSFQPFLILFCFLKFDRRKSYKNLAFLNPPSFIVIHDCYFHFPESVCCKLVLKWFGNVQVMDLLCSFCRVPFEDPEDAVLVRAMTRSLMEFSSVDWNKVATCQERRLKDEAEEPLEKLTVQFRWEKTKFSL